MLMIEDTDESTIDFWRSCKPSTFITTSLLFVFDKISPVLEFLTSLRFRVVPDVTGAQLSTFERDRICHCCDYPEAGILECSGVRIAPRSGAYHDESRERHHVGFWLLIGN